MKINFYPERRPTPKETRRGARGAPGASPPLAVPGGPLGALAAASHRIFAYKMSLTLKGLGTELFSTKHTERRLHLEVQSRASAALFRHPAGGGDHHRRPLHRHDFLQDNA